MKYLIGIGCGIVNYILYAAWIQDKKDGQKYRLLGTVFPGTHTGWTALLLFPLAEMFAAIVFTAYGYSFLKIVRYCLLMGALVPIGYRDHKDRIIPNRWLLCLAGIRITLFAVESACYPSFIVANVKLILGGAAAGGLILFAAYVISRHGIGPGDIKLFIVIGTYIGSQRTYIVILASLLIAACYSVVKIIRKRLNVKDEIAFAPFIAVGTTIILGLGF